MVEIHRVQSHNLELLGAVHPDAFDHAIDEAKAKACVASPDAILVVAVDPALEGGTVVGQCLAAVQRHPDKPNELFIDDLGVAETHRRCGIATRLVDSVIATARAAGAKVLWVGVDPTNAGAKAFYASMGLACEPAEIYEREI